MSKEGQKQLPLEQLRQIRIDKTEKLRKLGVDPYPSASKRTHKIGDILTNFEKFKDKEVTVAGRILSYRDHGKVSFLDVKDDSGTVQIYLKSNIVEKPNRANNEIGYDEIHLLDTGDFIETKGLVVKTKTGEVSVKAVKIRILAKALRRIPDKLIDKETRFRKRYIDINVNKKVYNRLLRRARFWKAHRDFFNAKGFVEMGIPILEHIPGGGDAEPFVTHMNAINEDFYLRISQELPLKRLIGAGYEKIYDIGPRFRNEGLSDEHLPEHYAMEFYWAYANWKQGITMIKELFDYILENVYEGKKKLEIRGFNVDFTKGWQILDFSKLMKSKFGINDIYCVTEGEIKKAYEKANIDIDFKFNIPRAVDNLWKILRKDIAGPAFLINHPKYLSPLQKPSLENPQMVERFQPIIAGSELGNGWSELNDPIDQFNRFKKQQDLRNKGDIEAQFMDIDYVEMLEYGMPPTFGYGHSERVFWFLENVSAREGVPFPQLKYEIDESAKKIYGVSGNKPK